LKDLREFHAFLTALLSNQEILQYKELSTLCSLPHHITTLRADFLNVWPDIHRWDTAKSISNNRDTCNCRHRKSITIEKIKKEEYSYNLVIP